MAKLKIGEKLLKNGIKLYLETEPSIYGSIIKDDKFYVIAFFYKNVFQKEYKKDSFSEAKVKLSVLIKNAYKQFIQSENENNIIKFSDFKVNEYIKYALLPKDLRNKNILYHSTEFESFVGIMADNELHGAMNYDFGVSTSRNKHYGFGRYQFGERTWDIEIGHNTGDIQLLLDKDKLQNNYKIDAFDWDEWKTRNKGEVGKYNDFHQSEDKIKTDVIKDIDKYILGVHIIKNVHVMEKFEKWYEENDCDFEYIFDENWKDITNNF